MQFLIQSLDCFARSIYNYLDFIRVAFFLLYTAFPPFIHGTNDYNKKGRQLIMG